MSPALLGFVLLAATTACAPANRAPDSSLEPLWRDFLKLPEPRALALAGHVDRIWVAGAASGTSQPDANEAALGECAKHRAERRMLDPCRLYATGSKVLKTR